MREMKDSGVEWIGEIPYNWEIISHKYVMHKEKRLCNHYNGEDVMSLTMGGIIKRDLENPSGKMPTTFDGYQFVEPNDLLLCLFDIDVTPRCVGLVKDFGVTSPAYSRFKVHSGYYPAYYDYLLRFIDDKKIFVHLAKNLRSSFTENDFGAIKTIVPSYTEQVRIVDFLDQKCAEVDAALGKIRASIEEYKKLKQAIITQAVTKGIRGDRPMKESEMEWIGDIPEDWDTMVNRRLFREEIRLPHDDDIPLSLSQIDGLIATNEMKEKSLKTSTYDGWKRVEVNDLVLNRFKAHLGVMFSATLEGIVSFHYGVYKPVVELNTKYYEYLCHSSSYRAIYACKSNGMVLGLQNLSNANFYSVISLYPTVAEQQEIAEYLDTMCSCINRTIQKKEHLINELEEYRSSLIYEYVTGKKEVNN